MVAAEMDRPVNTLAEGDGSIKQGQTRPRARSDATTCSRVILRIWAQNSSLSEPISRPIQSRALPRPQGILFVGHRDSHVSKTLFPHTYAGTRGVGILLHNATGPLLSVGGSESAFHVRSLTLFVTFTRKPFGSRTRTRKSNISHILRSDY